MLPGWESMPINTDESSDPCARFGRFAKHEPLLPLGSTATPTDYCPLLEFDRPRLSEYKSPHLLTYTSSGYPIIKTLLLSCREGV